MKKIQAVYEYNKEEIKSLALCWAVVIVISSFVAWQRNSTGIIGVAMVISAIADVCLVIPTLMGTMVTVSDVLEDLFKKEDY